MAIITKTKIELKKETEIKQNGAGFSRRDGKKYITMSFAEFGEPGYVQIFLTPEEARTWIASAQGYLNEHCDEN